MFFFLFCFFITCLLIFYLFDMRAKVWFLTSWFLNRKKGKKAPVFDNVFIQTNKQTRKWINNYTYYALYIIHVFLVTQVCGRMNITIICACWTSLWLQFWEGLLMGRWSVALTFGHIVDIKNNLIYLFILKTLNSVYFSKMLPSVSSTFRVDNLFSSMRQINH